MVAADAQFAFASKNRYLAIVARLRLNASLRLKRMRFLPKK